MSVDPRSKQSHPHDASNKREVRRGHQAEARFDFVLRMIALVAISWLVYFAYLRL